jgi:hypothetical protein
MMNDLEIQINYVVKLAKTLLLEQEGEFYPLCVYVNKDKQLIPISIFEENDHPRSSDIIEKFNSIISPKLDNDEILSYILAFDCKVNRNENDEKMDAIAINYYHKHKAKTTYFYPYTISNNNLEFQDPWGEMN